MITLLIPCSFLLTKRYSVLWNTLVITEKFLLGNLILRFQYFSFFLLYKVFLTNCSWSAHILMKSALLTRNPCNKYLFVDRNSYSLIWRDKSIMWACKNKDYFLHWCSIFLNFKLFIQSIMLRHTSVENVNHVKTFLLILCSS